MADQAEWFHEVKNNERVVCHFFRPTTWRCEIFDKHLQVLAARHLETRFIKINAEKAPFLAQRLDVTVIPTIICTKENFTADRLVGFEDLGRKDDFTTTDLARRLSVQGLVFPEKVDSFERDGYVPPQAHTKNAVKDNPHGKAVYSSKLTKAAELSDDDLDDD